MGSTEPTNTSLTQCKTVCSEAENRIAEKVYVCMMEPKHAASVAELERLCFHVPWSEQAFLDELQKNPNARYFVLLDKEHPTQVIAYGGYWKIFDEGHITNIAVRPECRQQGIAGKLLKVFMDFAEANKLAFLTLEVRASNHTAIMLYGSRGFRSVGRRKNYYEHPREDAIIMTREFTNAETETADT